MKLTLLASTCLAGLAAWSSPAVAQQDGAAPVTAAQDGADPAADQAPGDIIVTAQRRSENLQDVPVSVTALSVDTLRSRNLNDLQQITLAAPSLQISAENSFSVRGVGTLAFQQTVDPAVAVAIDEVSLSRGTLGENVFNDVAQVEVLNGPQGLLFGKNATAGLLNVTTVAPRLGVYAMNGEVEYNLRDTTPGDGQGAIARANVNIPFGDNSALRISSVYQYQQPVTRGSGTGARFDPTRRAYEVRAKYLADVSDALSVYLIGSYGETNGTAGLSDRNYRALGANSINAGPLLADGIAAGPDRLEYRVDGPTYRDLKIYGAQAKVTYTLPNDWQIINIAAWKGYDLDQAFDQDFTSSNGASLSFGRSKLDQISNELRLALPAGDRFTGQVGLYYLDFRERANVATAGLLYLPPFLLPTFPFCVGAVAVPGAFPPTCSVSNDFAVGSDNDYTFDSTSYAAFGQFTFELAPGLKLIGGARVTNDKVRFSNVQNQRNYFVRFGGPGGAYSDRISETNFSYKVGAQYEPTDAVTLYGTYATGYKGPGSNNIATANAARLAVLPETSRNVEAGVKTSLLDRRLTLNLSLFHTRYKDYQAASFDPALSSLFIQNAASLTSKGAEFSGTVRPFAGLTIDAAATLLSAKFDDFAGALCYAGQTGCAADGTFNAGGARTPASPKFTSSIGARYEVPLNDQVALAFGGDWYHRSSVNFTYAGNPLAGLGPVDLFGGRIGVSLGDAVQFSVFCKNCTDKRVPNFIYADPGDASQGINSTIQTFGFNSVRTIGGLMSFRF